MGETRCLCIFCLGHCLMSLALHSGFSDLWGSPPALSSTLALGFFCFWMLRHPVFKFTSLFLTQSVRLSLVTYPSLCSTYVTYRMPCHASGYQALPIQPLPREAEGSPRGDNHSKHVPLPQYLAWLHQFTIIFRFVFIHIKTIKILLVVKTLIKKHREATLISSHENKEQYPH